MKYQRTDGTFRDNYPQSFGPPDLAAFAAFLDASDGTVTLREVAEGKATDGQVAVRHDVDHNLDHALRFARWEASRGTRATYFILPGQWYAQEPTFADGLHELVELGHEVGLHSDVVSATFIAGDAVDGTALPAGHCERAAQRLRDHLAILRGHGIDVVGSAAHGSAVFYSHGIHNNDLWAAGYKPEDFGLIYEAYHLHRSSTYISDNHGKWTSPLRIEPGRMTHVLTHPCHWDLSSVGDKVAA